jgi:hypothetical protein
MSEKQEHRRRYEARLRYLARFEAWQHVFKREII